MSLINHKKNLHGYFNKLLKNAKNMMKKSQQKNIFYEAMWFSEDDSKEPVIRGSNVDEIIKKLLEITKDKEGRIEVYQISSNDRGYKIHLQKKIDVLNELNI